MKTPVKTVGRLLHKNKALTNYGMFDCDPNAVADGAPNPIGFAVYHEFGAVRTMALDVSEMRLKPIHIYEVKPRRPYRFVCTMTHAVARAHAAHILRLAAIAGFSGTEKTDEAERKSK